MEKQGTKLKDILSSAVFACFIAVVFILNLVIPSPDVLSSERRLPARFPELTASSVLSGTFMARFEEYAADHFIFRDEFRGINAFIVLGIYQQLDKSGLYRSNNVGIGEFKRTDEDAFVQTSEKIKRAAQSFDGLDMKIYYTILPDKSIYAEQFMPGLDMDRAEDIVTNQLGEYTYIRLADVIGADSYYRTDIHWDQSKITGVAGYLLSSMDANPIIVEHEKVLAGQFHGVYAGQLALPVPFEPLIYLDITGLEVSYLNDKTQEFEAGPIYDISRLGGVDPYDIFLRGPQPLIVIKNNNVPERELYLFRDSFGSSLAPLLTGAYSKITVIDLRYIHLSIISQFIEFIPGSDVLFSFGSQIFNNPSVLLS